MMINILTVFRPLLLRNFIAHFLRFIVLLIDLLFVVFVSVEIFVTLYQQCDVLLRLLIVSLSG